MHAIVYERYGAPDVMQFQQVPRPEVAPGRVLVKVHAASLNAADWRLMRGTPFIARLYAGIRRPRFRILGSDLAGRVEAIGSGVTAFKPGDAVFGDVFASGFGAFAEYASVRAEDLLHKPANLSFAEAAALPLAAATALQGLRKVPQKPGRKVLIHGAGGGVGLYAVQMAMALGDQVTAICGPGTVQTLRDLGVERCLDYTRHDFTTEVMKYDLILGVNGNRNLGDYRRALTEDGAYVMVGGGNRQLFQALLLGPWVSLFSRRKCLALSAKTNGSDLALIRDWVEQGKVRPIIDRRFPLDQTGEALRHLEAGHAKGKVVIEVIPD